MLLHLLGCFGVQGLGTDLENTGHVLAIERGEWTAWPRCRRRHFHDIDDEVDHLADTLEALLEEEVMRRSPVAAIGREGGLHAFGLDSVQRRLEEWLGVSLLPFAAPGITHPPVAMKHRVSNDLAILDGIESRAGVEVRAAHAAANFVER